MTRGTRDRLSVLSAVVLFIALLFPGNPGQAAPVSENSIGSPTSPGASAVALSIGAGWSLFQWFAPGPVFAIEGPFTFTNLSPVVLKVTDNLCPGDQFRVYDNGVAIGNTSAVPVGPCLGFLPPDTAFADPRLSHGTFVLPPGSHSITVQVIANPFGSGAGHLRVDLRDPRPNLVVETSVEEAGPYHAGQTIHYVDVVRNLGGAMSPGDRILVMNRLPPGTTFRSATVTGGTCASTPPDVSCERGGLGFGGSFEVRVEVTLTSRLPGNRMVTKQAHVDPKNEISESNENDNRDEVTIPLLPAP